MTKITSCRRERINQGGYDSSGYYWGTGQPLYRVEVENDEEWVAEHYRADDRVDAIRQCIEKHNIRQRNVVCRLTVAEGIELFAGDTGIKY